MSLKKRLKNGETVFGTWCLIPSPVTINIIAQAGLDFVLIDMEHGPIDFRTAQQMVMAAEANNCEAVIRVGDNNENTILKALDVGSSGIIVPHIESKEQGSLAISYMKYPPIGIRGYSPYTRAGGYSYRENYTKEANENILTGIIIEGSDGIKNISTIIDDKELDLVYVGTYDISISLGIPGDVQNERVLGILESCVKMIRDKEKIAGCLFHNKDDLDYFRKIGIQFLAYKVDSSVLHDGFSLLKGWL